MSFFLNAKVLVVLKEVRDCVFIVHFYCLFELFLALFFLTHSLTIFLCFVSLFWSV